MGCSHSTPVPVKSMSKDTRSTNSEKKWDSDDEEEWAEDPDYVYEEDEEDVKKREQKEEDEDASSDEEDADPDAIKFRMPHEKDAIQRAILDSARESGRLGRCTAVTATPPVHPKEETSQPDTARATESSASSGTSNVTSSWWEEPAVPPARSENWWDWESLVPSSSREA